MNRLPDAGTGAQNRPIRLFGQQLEIVTVPAPPVATDLPVAAPPPTPWAMAHLSEHMAAFSRTDLFATALADAPGAVAVGGGAEAKTGGTARFRPALDDPGLARFPVAGCGGRRRKRRARSGRNCRCRDRNGRVFVLTVGAGLGYGLSRKPDVGERGSAGGERVNKSDIAGHVAGRTGVARSAAGDAVDVVFEAIGEALARGEDVRIVGFGIFGTRSRPARTGRNPRTGESMEIAASTAPTFKAGKPLRDAVNAGGS